MSAAGHSRIHRRFLVLGVVALVLAACTSQGTQPRTSPHVAKSPRTCPLSKQLVPGCGALWGVTTQDPTIQGLSAAENAVHRRFDMVYRFHDINDVIPDAAERAAVASGHILHISLDARDYGNPQATITWSGIADGSYDPSYMRQAEGIASLKEPVFVTFDHEPDQDAKRISGTPAQFVSAWRHIHDLFRTAGVSNVRWVWVVMGWQPTMAQDTGFWPGNNYVDWISWDVYNHSGCQTTGADPAKYVSFIDAVRPFYQWIHDYGPRVGINASKPMMISEAGSARYQNDLQKTAAWYQQIPSVLESFPQIKAITLWDHSGTGRHCDFRFDHIPVVLKAVTVAGHQTWVNPRLK